MEQSVHRPFLLGRDGAERPSTWARFLLGIRSAWAEWPRSRRGKTLQATPTYRYWISDSHGEVVVLPMGIRAAALPHSQTWARKGSMEQSVHRPFLSLRSVCRDGGVKPLQATPTYRYRISDSHGRGRSTSPMGIRAAALPHFADLGRKSMEQSVHRPFLARSALPRWRGKTSKPPRRIGIGISIPMGEVVVPRPWESEPQPSRTADLGRERVDGAERPSTLSLPARLRRDGGVNPPSHPDVSVSGDIGFPWARAVVPRPWESEPQPSRTRRLGQEGSMEQSVHRPFLPARLSRDGGVKPPSHPDVSVSISDSHGRGRSTAHGNPSRSPPALADLGKESGRWSRASIDPFLLRSVSAEMEG